MTPLTEEAFLDALRSRGADRLRRVRFRRNRRTIWSLTQGGTVLNLHVGYRQTTPDLLDHFALIVRHPRGGPPAVRRARDRVQRHPPLREALRRIRATPPPRSSRRRARRCLRPGPNCATPEQQAYLEALYRRLAARSFPDALPRMLPLRLSRRMRSTLGWVALGEREGSRAVGELALNLDLMLEVNDELRVDVMLHEMAHIEAWLLHADRGHGAAWKSIARRVGCRPRARFDTPLIARADRGDRILRVPPLPA
ncbi:MAG: hypothetical protein EA351_12860 [Gemmatimonadales bacterium]|nr:MAG: hypothetical protein EA351_12860 [Gemmatimonadales bacterium]